MTGSKRTVVIICALVFLLAFTAASVAYFVRTSMIERENTRIQAAAEPYEFEKRALERELASIMKPLPGGSSITIAVLDLDEMVYERIWGMFAYASTGEADTDIAVSRVEAGEKLLLNGTLCLSYEELPDMTGNMSSDELRIMLDSGWDTAVYVTAKRAGELDAYLKGMRSRMSELGIPDFDTVYFEEGVYSSALYDGVLRANGVDTVINAIDDNVDPGTRDISDDLWRVGAIGWSGTKGNPTAGNALKSILENHGAAVFAVETWHGADRNENEHFVPGLSDSSFESMLFKLLDSVRSGDLHVVGASGTREIYETYIEEYDLYKNVYEPRQIEIKARLREIETALAGIYAGE